MQPVPCVCRCRCARPGTGSRRSPSNSRSTGWPGRWPPLTRTHRGPSAASAAAARRMPSSSVICSPVSSSASYRLGVTTVASGSSSPLDRVQGAGRQQAVAVLGHRHRVHHERRGGGRPACSATVSTIAGGGQHPGLHRLHADVAEHRVQLGADRGQGQLPVALHADRVLRGDRADHAHPVHAEGEHRLQVGLHPGAAAGVRAGDSEHAGRSGRHDAQPTNRAHRRSPLDRVPAGSPHRAGHAVERALDRARRQAAGLQRDRGRRPAAPFPRPVTVTTPSLTVHAPPSIVTTRAPG